MTESTEGARGRGAVPAAERDPARLCTANTQDGRPCPQFKMAGLDVCHMHGGGTPAAKDKSEVARTTAALGLPAVPVRDYPDMVGGHIAVLHDEANMLNQAIANRRMGSMDEIELHRDLRDSFEDRDRKLALIAKMAGSVASLSIARAANTAADANAEFLRSKSFAAVIATVIETLDDFPEAQAALADRLWSLVEQQPGA